MNISKGISMYVLQTIRPLSNSFFASDTLQYTQEELFDYTQIWVNQLYYLETKSCIKY